MKQIWPYHPGFPVFLAPFLPLFGDRPWDLAPVTIALTLAAGALGYLYTRSATAVTLFWLNPAILFYATTTLSEELSVPLFWLVLWSLQRNRPAWTVLAGLACGYGLVVRTSGAFVVAGALLGLMLLRRFRDVGVVAVLSLAVHWLTNWILPGVESSGTQLRQASAYFGRLLHPNYYVGWVKDLGSSISEDILPLQWWAGGRDWMHVLAGLAFLALFAGAVWCRRQDRLWLAVSLCYLAGHVIWPFPSSRYFLALLPGMFWPLRRPVAFALLAFFLASDFKILSQARRLEALTREHLALFEGAGKRLAPGERVFCLYAGQCQWLAGFESVSLPGLDRFGDLFAEAASKRVTAVFVDRSARMQSSSSGLSYQPLPKFFEQKLQTSPLVETVYQDRWGGLYRLKPLPPGFAEAYRGFRERQILDPVLEPLIEYRQAAAEALLQAGQTGKAMAIFEELMARQPAYPEMALAASDHYLRLGQPQKARKAAERALQIAKALADPQVEQEALSRLRGPGTPR